MNIRIDRLMDDLAAINAIGRLEGGGNRRRALSPEDMEGRALLLDRMQAAGLETRVDAAGNVFGRLESDHGVNDGTQPAVLIGSHIDTIERGGRFDGVLGVFGALECLRTIGESGVARKKPIEVVAFTDEEERFIGFLGSYALVGSVGYDDIKDCVDHNGTRLYDAMQRAGLDPHRIADAAVDPADYCAFLELHIEQGSVLEREGKIIGVVDGVKGNFRWGVTITGQTDHAGAPLTGRKDAFSAFHDVAARMIAFRNKHGDDDSTLTIGRVLMEPNIETAQPGRVEFSVDFRSSSVGFLRRADSTLSSVLQELTENGGYTVDRHQILVEDPVEFDRGIRPAIERSAEKRGYPWRAMPSGAGHDAQVIGRHIPSAMIFVPSVDGRSHCPEEFTRTPDIEAGVNVLLDTALSLAIGEGT